MTRDWGTGNTVPKHIWMHNVQTAAILAGAPADMVMSAGLVLMTARWFHAGEPIWMAAESLTFVAKRRAISARAEAETAGLRRILRDAVREERE